MELDSSYVAALVVRGAEFLREAPVLVFVFALLDKILRAGVSLVWIVGTVTVAVYLFIGGIVLEVEGRRRLATIERPNGTE